MGALAIVFALLALTTMMYTPDIPPDSLDAGFIKGFAVLAIVFGLGEALALRR